MESKGYHHRRRKWRKRRKLLQFEQHQCKNQSCQHFQQELITEILLRLPVKPLLQFRSVSKSWLALISSPQFIKTHLRLSTSDNKDCTHHMLTLNYGRSVSKSCGYNFKDRILKSLHYEPVTKAFDLDYPIHEWSNKLHDHSIVGSVHGLICLDIKYIDLFLWNPSIRKYKKLPDCSPTWNNASTSICGFGYDEFHDDYKVVITLYRYGSPDEVEVKIYSLRSDSWKYIDGYPSGKLLTISGKFVNGKLHWSTNNFNIISFDLADEKWEKVEHPLRGEGDDDFLCLGVLGTDLCFCRDNRISDTDVWVMKVYGVKESWKKMLAIKHSILWGTRCVPPSFTSNKGEILVYLGSSIVIYNSKDGSLRYSRVDFDRCRGAEIYVESLVWPLSA